jgi:3',5'-cyclic AMP phosphodiesterase CpdA
MLIAQITDTHISARGKKAYSLASMAENLTRCIEHINQLKPRPDLALITGDITYSDQQDEYHRAASLLAQLDMPWFVIPGNHDSRKNLLASFDAVNCPLAQQDLAAGFVNYVIDEFPVRLIALDSTRDGDHPGGEICETRAAWLEQQLSSLSDKPTIIFIHHPPVKMGMLETDKDGFIGAQRLGAIVEKYPCIERLICGHVHLPMFARWRGTIVSTAPSIGLELRLDLTMKRPSQFYLAEPAYMLHHWTTSRDLVTHTVSIKEKPGPYSF